MFFWEKLFSHPGKSRGEFPRAISKTFSQKPISQKTVMLFRDPETSSG